MQSENDPIINEIIGIEWKMFASVNNIGGEADCQRQPETFDIMRRSQYLTWPTILLCSYRTDLREAAADGRNVMTEKYARMMEHTSPEAYAEIAPYLPPVDEGALQLVDEAAALLMPWEAEMRERYPFLDTRGRELELDGVGKQGTSFETYLRAELATYSRRTLGLYVNHLRGLAEKGENASRLVYENMMKLHGYADLEDASARYDG